MPTRKLHSLIRKWRHVLPVLMTLSVLGFAFFFLFRALEEYTLSEILTHARRLSGSDVAVAGGLVLVCYLLLAIYDILAFRYLGQSIQGWRAVFTGFIASAFNNSIGLGTVAGSSIRLRMYSRLGFRVSDVFRIIVFASLTFWLGFLALAGVALVLQPVSLPVRFGLTDAWLRFAGFACLALVVFYLWLTISRVNSLRFRGMRLDIPNLTIGLSQILVASTELAALNLILFILLPDSVNIGYWHLLSIYVTAQAAALISHVPGGVGVLEAVLLYLLPKGTPLAAVAGSLLVFRVFYFILPLIIAALCLSLYEVWTRWLRFRSPVHL